MPNHKLPLIYQLEEGAVNGREGRSGEETIRTWRYLPHIPDQSLNGQLHTSIRARIMQPATGKN